MAGSTTAPTAQQGDDAQHITTVREMAQDVRKCSWKEYGSGAGSQEEALLPPTSPTSPQGGAPLVGARWVQLLEWAWRRWFGDFGHGRLLVLGLVVCPLSCGEIVTAN